MTACHAQGFACVKSTECCGGLGCIGGVCTNPTADMAQMASKPDMARGGGNSLVCGGLLDCLGNCMGDPTCRQNCGMMASQLAVQYYNSVVTCIFGDMNLGGGACPAFNGGVCDDTAPNYVDAKCTACINAATDQGGACFNKYIACLADCNVDNDCAQLTCGGQPCTCQQGVCG